MPRAKTTTEEKEMPIIPVSGQNVQSEPKIYAAMLGIMGDMDAIVKKKQSGGVNYAFRSIDDVMNVLHPLLVKHGVFVVPVLRRLDNRVFEQDKTDTKGNVVGKRNMFQSVVESAYQFTAIDGSYVETIVGSESSDYSDKATQQALSYTFKIAVLQTFCVPTKELVTDGDERTPDVSGTKVTPKDEKKSTPPAPPVEVMPKEAWDTLKKELEQFELDDTHFTNWAAGNLRALNLPVPARMNDLPKAHGRMLYPIAKSSNEEKKLLLVCYKCKGTDKLPNGDECDACDEGGYFEFK